MWYEGITKAMTARNLHEEDTLSGVLEIRSGTAQRQQLQNMGVCVCVLKFYLFIYLLFLFL